MAKKNGKAVAKKDAAELTPEMAGEMFDLKENMQGIEPRFPQIAIAHSAQIFVMPDNTKVESISCIILDMNRANAYWEAEFTGGGTPPDCFSIDGVSPDHSCDKLQAQSCPECEQNKFGTDRKGRGKACKNMKRVHVIMEGEMLPYRLTLPPSSIKSVDTYVSLLTSGGTPYQLMRTRISLKQAANNDGIEYAEAVFEKLEAVTDKVEAMQLKEQWNRWKDSLRGQEILSGELGGEDVAGEGEPPM